MGFGDLTFDFAEEFREFIYKWFTLLGLRRRLVHEFLSRGWKKAVVLLAPASKVAGARYPTLRKRREGWGTRIYGNVAENRGVGRGTEVGSGALCEGSFVLYLSY